MNLHTSIDDKDAIIHRLRTHISILEQQSNSNGYFSYEETPSVHEHYSIDTNQKEDIASLEKLLQKREYELDQLREQLNEFHQEADEKLRRTVEQFNDSEKRLSIIETERNNLRQQLQQLQDENDLMKSYLNHLPSSVEHQKLQQSYEILKDQLNQSNKTINEYRKEKNNFKKQLEQYQQTLEEQEKTIETHKQTANQYALNAKCLTMDERVETEKKFAELKRIIQELNEKLNQEIANRKQWQYLNETNTRTVESLSIDVNRKDQTIREMTSLLRQNRQELDDLRLQLIVSQQEQARLNERLLSNIELANTLQRVHATVEKLFLVLDFSYEILDKQSITSPDVLMLQLSNHRNKSDPIEPTVENMKKIENCDVEKLECKLDEIVDRLLSIRSELITRQFENDLESNVSCRLQ